MRKSAPAECPCGSGRTLENCCGRYIGGGAAAPDAEALMRSRYTAYVLRDEAYLLATWHSSTRPARLDLEAGAQQWIGLKVKSHQAQDEFHASVDFVARYRVNGRAHKLEEFSRFLKEGGRWYYVSALT